MGIFYRAWLIDSSTPYILWFRGIQSFDGFGLQGHGLLNQSMEKLASMCGKAAVKTKSKFIQVGLKVSRCDGTLMSADQPSFQK